KPEPARGGSFSRGATGAEEPADPRGAGDLPGRQRQGPRAIARRQLPPARAGVRPAGRPPPGAFHRAGRAERPAADEGAHPRAAPSPHAPAPLPTQTTTEVSGADFLTWACVGWPDWEIRVHSQMIGPGFFAFRPCLPPSGRVILRESRGRSGL